MLSLHETRAERSQELHGKQLVKMELTCCTHVLLPLLQEDLRVEDLHLNVPVLDENESLAFVKPLKSEHAPRLVWLRVYEKTLRWSGELGNV